MRIPLDQFEQAIDEKILKRGLSYYKKGLVRELEEVSPNTYEAVVEGTENYSVRLTIDNNVVTESVCDCPYDQGPVCKHVAAVVFKLLEESLQLNQKQSKSRPKNKASTGKKRKTIAEQIDEMLSKASREELVGLIKEEAASNTAFRNRLMMTLEQYNDNITKDFYAKQIKALLRSAKGSYGFVDWQSSKFVGQSVFQMLDAAQKAFEHGNYQNALCVSFAVMEVLVPALNEIDDSSGTVGDCIHVAYDMLCEMGIDVGSESLSRQIFDFCVHHYENNTFKGWDWHIDALHLAVAIAKTQNEYDRLLALLDSEQETEVNGLYDRYGEHQRQLVKYRLLVKAKGNAVAEDYLQHNMDNPDLRRVAIENAMNRKDYGMAIAIAKAGIAQDEKQYPGLAKEWYDWLLKIAQAQDDTGKILEYARFLLIDNFRNEQDYYQILKQHVSPDHWSAYVDGLIQDLEAKNRGYNSGLVANMLIKEERWEQLWELVSEFTSLQYIEQYESYLSKRNPDRLAELYARCILEYMEYNMGRNHYENTCRFIRKIIKLGERQKANEVIETLRLRYPKRRALMEELDKV